MLLRPSWCTRPHKLTLYRALYGQSGRVKKCGKLSSLCIFLVHFPDHPEHARQASYFSEPPSPSPVFYTSPRSSSCQCCGAWCCDLVSRTFFRPHYHRYPTPNPSSLSSSSSLPHANADEPFTGAYRCPNHRTLIFSLIAVPANTLAHANTFGVPA